ncbi:hypothetical protein [Fusobacterium polymorphum]|uniref:hypothetical protein n=1 Tax=Fusobacterium nucleatum subsp. polymorphum TaxID=76857 RepID=UPI00300A5640
MRNFKLKAFFTQNGIKFKDVAKDLKITESTFSQKINRKNGKDFTTREIRYLCEKYNLSSDNYFF